ncbi:MAG: invasion associated locus B family protein [Nitratireductor sp.]|jgi:invasion protein IalB|nr:invasion associated locus B family protein [Nitratireductor sp.]
MRSRITALHFLAFAAIASPALAQETEAPTPSRSTEAYEAWTVECTNVTQAPAAKPAEGAAKNKPAEGAATPEPAATKRICEAAQVFTNRKTGNEIARFVFALDPEGSGATLAGMRTMVDVSMDKAAAIVDGETEIAAGKIMRCSGNYCFVKFEIDQKKIDQFLKAAKPGVQYPIASGQMLRIEMSAAGLANALAALKNKK